MEQTNQTAAEPQKDNLSLYNKLRKVPQDAQKKIEDGRLKGKTDINPMWKIKVLTENFGPCGLGNWKVEVTRKWIEKGDEDTYAAFVDVNLYIKNAKTGEWSAPIPGTGGNNFRRKENSGRNYIDDDCYKKAMTDAIGSAAKLLGLAADIYWEQDKGKYSENNTSSQGAVIRNRPSEPETAKKPELTPESTRWNSCVAHAMAMNETTEKIRQRIGQKYTITDQNFRALMKAAGKSVTQ